MSKVTVIFTLSMPGVASWNGKWSGEGKCYARTRRVSQKVADSLKGYYHYSWKDGWAAGVSVKASSGSAETSKVARKSLGFYGYDWMIDSILKHGAIYADHEVPEKAEVNS